MQIVFWSFVRSKLKADAIGRMDKAIRINQAERFELLSDGLRGVENDGRLLQAAEHTPAHPAKPGRARVPVGIEKAAKGVQVVTVNADAPRRQGMDELGITMIANVEN